MEMRRWTLSQLQLLFEEVQGIQFYRRKIHSSGNNILMLELGSVEEIQRLLKDVKFRNVHVHVSETSKREELQARLSRQMKNGKLGENDVIIISADSFMEWMPNQPLDLIMAPRGLKGVASYQEMETVLEWMRQRLSKDGIVVFDQWVPPEMPFSVPPIYFKGFREINDKHSVLMLESIHDAEKIDSSLLEDSNTIKRPRMVVKCSWFEVYDRKMSELVQKFFTREHHAIFSIDEIMELASTKFKNVIFLGNHDTEELYKDGDPVMITILSRPMKH